MHPRQLCFFKFERPLLALLGAEFFRQAPRTPGVYLLVGKDRRVLYVGQSKNLRVRLSYYKNAQPEREPKRIIRLIHQVREIELKPCASVAEAKLREVELIQEHQPRFNVQHALSRTYTFFGIRPRPDSIHVRLTLEATPSEGERLIGSFKNRGLCRRALFALGRTAWARQRPPSSVYDFPICLMDRTRVQEIQAGIAGADPTEVEALCRGESPAFALHVEDLAAKTHDPFLREIHLHDHTILLEFFALAQRMKGLREQAGFTGLLPQREVDRSLVSRSATPPEH